MQNDGVVGPSGMLKSKKITPQKAPFSWRMRNALRFSYIRGLLGTWLAIKASSLTGMAVVTSELSVRLVRGATRVPVDPGNEDSEVLYRGGTWTDYGVVSRQVVTNNGVAFIVDAWQNTVELENMKFHGVGTGVTAENVADSALVTESTTILNPDSTRASGVQTESAANQLVSTATATFDGAGAITEHGLFSQAATGGGVLFDRSVFAAMNVISGDGLQFIYTVTFTAGS